MADFSERNRSMASAMATDKDLSSIAHEFLLKSAQYEYSYHFSWLGLPIIQFPQDVLAVQEILWSVKPELVVETGIARGGSLALSASVLELIGGDGLVVGVDVEIRAPNRRAIAAHRLAHRIRMIEGSSTDPSVVHQVHELASGRNGVVVLLDSNHAHQHVLRELELYSPLVQAGGYVVVFDTAIEDMPGGSFPNRPWDKGNNPATAVQAFLAANDRFKIDRAIEDKLLFTVAPGGYLRCIKDPT